MDFVAGTSVVNLPRVDLHDLAGAKPPSAQYVVDGLIPDALVLLGGHGGAGKSILALAIAAHVAAGVAFSDRQVRRGRVVYASLEDPAEIVRWRLQKIVQAYRLDARAVAARLVILDGSGGDATLAAERLDAGSRWIMPTATLTELREAAVGSVLVIVDNASDAFDGNENDRRQVRAFLRLLAALGRDVGAAMLLLAHIDKAAARSGPAGNSYSGSTAWHNSARARFALGKDGGAIVLAMEKNNLGPLAAPLMFRWNDSGVLIPTTAAELVSASANDPDVAGDNAAVLKCLRAATCDVPTATMGAFTAFHALKHRPDMPVWALKGAEGKARFARALVRLERIGRIRREEYQTRHRHRSERWIAVGECEQ